MPPPQAKTSTVLHRVPFYETDAMRVVHHANYVRYLELARVVWLDEHVRPYSAFMDEGRHFATMHVEVDYKRSAAYDDVVEITTWLAWVRGASLRMEYELSCKDEVLATAVTEHAMVDESGRVQRIAREERERLRTLMTDAESAGPSRT